MDRPLQLLRAQFTLATSRFPGSMLRILGKSPSRPPTTVVVDGRSAQGARTGIGEYVLRLLEHWPGRGRTVAVLVTSPNDVTWPFDGKIVASRAGPLWHIRAAVYTLLRRATYLSPESMLVPILLGKRAAWTVHDLTATRFPELHSRRNVWFHRLFLRLAIRRVGCIFVPTVSVGRDISHAFPRTAKRIVVVGRGPRGREANPPVSATRPPPEVSGSRPIPAPYVLFVGTVEPRKNVLALIRAFLDVAPQDWHLVIAGKVGWLSDEEASLFHSLTSARTVIFLGYVDDDRLNELYGDAALFCYVSAAEGFGLPLLEAMSYGLPIIHSDDPALAEVAGDAGRCVRLTSLPEDLRAALHHLTRDPLERGRLSASSACRARDFSWTAAAKVTADELAAIANAYCPVSGTG